jgi:hypothetical protein
MPAGCARLGCSAVMLASWWQLCVGCTSPLMDAVRAVPGEVVDRHRAAGWEALAWAERISPSSWGNASDDEWVTAKRCLAFAVLVSGRSTGCVHTSWDVPQPVLAVARAPGVLRCPTCAESVVATTSTVGGACDRCRFPAFPPARVAVVTGNSLIVVAQLCAGCRGVVHAL